MVVGWRMCGVGDSCEVINETIIYAKKSHMAQNTNSNSNRIEHRPWPPQAGWKLKVYYSKLSHHHLAAKILKDTWAHNKPLHYTLYFSYNVLADVTPRTMRLTCYLLHFSHRMLLIKWKIQYLSRTSQT